MDRNVMGNAGDVCWDTVGMFQVGIKGGISPFWELRNLAVLAQELALKNGRDGLSGIAWGGGLWAVMGGVRPLSSRLSPPALPVGDRGLSHHLRCSHP